MLLACCVVLRVVWIDVVHSEAIPLDDDLAEEILQRIPTTSCNQKGEGQVGNLSYNVPVQFGVDVGDVHPGTGLDVPFEDLGVQPVMQPRWTLIPKYS